MKRMLDLLHLSDTGHVLAAVVRDGSGDGPAVATLVAAGCVYPYQGSPDVDEIVMPEDPDGDIYARTTVELDAAGAGALFHREEFAINKEGKLAQGLSSPSVSFNASGVTLTFATPTTEEIPALVVGVPQPGISARHDRSVVPANSSSFVISSDIDTGSFAKALVFVKGYRPTVA